MEKALKSIHKDTDWTEDEYTMIYGLLENATENSKWIVKGKQGCERYEAKIRDSQVKELEQQEKDVHRRLLNGKKMIAKECSRIFQQLTEAKNLEWNKATIEVKLNGPVLKNDLLQELASQVHDLTIKTKNQAYDVDCMEKLDECYHNIQQVTSSLEHLQHRMQLEMERRERMEEQAKAEVLERQKLQRERTKKKDVQEVVQEKVVEDEMTDQDKLNRLEKLAEARRMEISGELQIIIQAEKKAAQKNQYGEMQLYAKKQQITEEGMLSDFENSVFGYRVDNKPTKLNQVSAKTGSTMKGLSKLKAKRQQRLEQKLSAEKQKLQQLHELKRSEQLKAIEVEKRKEMELVEREKNRQEEIRNAQAMLDEGEDDTEDELRQRANARKILMKFKGNIWQLARNGNVEMLKNYFLVEGTANLLAKHNFYAGEGGRTLLHTSAWYGQVTIVQFLLGIGAHVEAIDTAYSRCTPLMEAARGNRFEVCKVLISYGAKLTAQDCHGDTALHWAARKGYGGLLVSMVQWVRNLVPRSPKSEFDVKNYKGKTCLDVAKNETVRMLAKKRFGEEIREIEQRNQHNAEKHNERLQAMRKASYSTSKADLGTGKRLSDLEVDLSSYVYSR